MRPLTMLLCVACGGDSATFTGPEPVLPPQIRAWSLVHNPDVPLTRTVEVSVTPSATLTLLATGPDGERIELGSPADTSHRLTLLGLEPGTTYTLDVIAENESGRFDVSDTVTIDPLPVPLPQITVHVDAPERTPGVYLMPMTNDDRTGTWVAILDHTGAPLWLYDAHGARFHEVLPIDGGIRGISGSNIVEVGWDGELMAVYRASEVLGLDETAFHHEVFADDDGRLVTLIEREVIADDLPGDYDDPTPQDPVAIGFDEVVTFAPGGTDVQRWEVTSLLDTSRIGWDSLRDLGNGRLDWGRSNSVTHDPVGDDWLVSVRHQDAIVAIDRSSGELSWILANPEGWSPELDAMRLQPVGEVQWPYHQHAAKMISDDELMLFDNGNKRTTPFDGQPDTTEIEWYSRVAIYGIDRSAGTVTQVWDWQPLPTLYSASQGDVDVLPSGNLLVDFAYVRHEGGVSNEEMNVGLARTRILEVDRGTGAVHFDLELWEEGTGPEHAWFAYRVQHMDTFPPEAP